jgi:uncharacterized Fe-S cluster protein YjdI
METEKTHTYTNGEITVAWKPASCIHSKNCWKGLISVFNPGARPWIDMKGGSSEEIMAQIDKCPSGALSYYKNAEMEGKVSIDADTIIEASPNGPLLVYGNVIIKDKSGNETKRNKVTAFCRCGQSQNKPFCDGSHVAAGFEG